MAKAKKLPSGSWRCLAYSHTEKVWNEKEGKWKDKRIYKSFTSDDPSAKGRKEAELAAAQFQASNSRTSPNKRQEYGNMTLTEAIDAYIDSRSGLRSPTTIQDYRCIQKNAFQDLMETKLKDLDEIILMEAVNAESRRSNNRRNDKKPISAKRLKNEWGLLTAVLNVYRKDLDYNITLPPVPERVPELLPADLVLQMVKGTDIELPVLLACWLSYSMSEVRGLTKSKSLKGDYLIIAETVVNVSGKAYRKEIGKNPNRNRMHRIPPYIKRLIDRVEGDIIVPMTGSTLYHKWINIQKKNNVENIMTFHDLRHPNASVMALLSIPDRYAQDRGGWKSDKVMKKTYMQVFSDERIKVDNIIDDYFEKAMQHEMQHEKKRP